MQHLRGDGEFINEDKKIYTRLCFSNRKHKVTLNLKNYSNDTAASSSLGPFTVSSSTTKVDTRARARAIALKSRKHKHKSRLETRNI